jgi:hypothetical protein
MSFNACSRKTSGLRSPALASSKILAAMACLAKSSESPVHDWTSHAADSFRYLALTLDRRALQTGFNRRIEYSHLGHA